MSRFLTLFKISRPRFWLYLAGPWMVGWFLGLPHDGVRTLGAQYLVPLTFWRGFLFFLLPANFFLYGINDFFDGDTDALNQKKADKEHLLLDSERHFMRWTLLGSLILSVIYYLTLQGGVARLLFVIWFALSFFYSAPPLRFKARPFLDSASNVLYALPGMLAFYQTVHCLPPLWVWVAAWLWTAAMHLFSAVPDIEADQKAGLRTMATVLEYRWSLALCSALWLNVAWLVGRYGALTLVGTNDYSALRILVAILVWVYPALPLLPLLNPKWDVDRVYWWFPWINGAVGCGLFWWGVLAR